MPITYRLVDSKGELIASGDTIGYLKGVAMDTVGEFAPGTGRAVLGHDGAARKGESAGQTDLPNSPSTPDAYALKSCAKTGRALNLV